MKKLCYSLRQLFPFCGHYGQYIVIILMDTLHFGEFVQIVQISETIQNKCMSLFVIFYVLKGL